MNPVFSIGVTTYNRPDLLKQCLASILAQGFQDFEVIVGNDYPPTVVTAESLGMRDPRMRLVNHPKNLRERGNMNALLAMGRGRYFTWLADDDLYAPDFLDHVHEALKNAREGSCVFTGYRMIYGAAAPELAPTTAPVPRTYPGGEFLREWFVGNRKAIGIYGVFDRVWLVGVGGIEMLCNSSIELYCEYMLMLRAGLLERILYLDAPLICYREHECKWSAKSNPEIFKEAGANLLEKSLPILSAPSLQGDFRKNFSSVLKLVCGGVSAWLHHQQGRPVLREMLVYLGELRRRIRGLKGSPYYWPAMGCLMVQGLEIVRINSVSRLKSLLPARLLSLGKKLRGR